MRRTVTITAILFVFTTGICFAGKPKMVVQMYAYDFQVGAVFQDIVDAYFILPDGTHVHGTCMSGILDKVRCQPESWTPEKRTPSQCQATQAKEGKHCIYQENYYADRKLNDLTIYAANGKIVFHLKDSW